MITVMIKVKKIKSVHLINHDPVWNGGQTDSLINQAQTLFKLHCSSVICLHNSKVAWQVCSWFQGPLQSNSTSGVDHIQSHIQKAYTAHLHISLLHFSNAHWFWFHFNIWKDTAGFRRAEGSYFEQKHLYSARTIF